MSPEEEKRDRAIEELQKALNTSDEERLKFKRKHKNFLLYLLGYRINNLVEEAGNDPETGAVLVGEYVEGLTVEVLQSIDGWIVSMLRKALVDLLKEADNPANGVQMFKSYTEYLAERAAHIAGYNLINEGDEDEE